MVGTSAVAWLQGVDHGVVADSLLAGFLPGEIEHAIWSAWVGSREDFHPEVIVVEGYGSILCPSCPCGLEVLGAGCLDGVVLQHAPARVDYVRLPGHRIEPLSWQIDAIETASGVPVVAIAVSHESLAIDEIDQACRVIADETDLPVFDVLRDGAFGLVSSLSPLLITTSARASIN